MPSNGENDYSSSSESSINLDPAITPRVYPGPERARSRQMYTELIVEVLLIL
jgi:hypothetical protein